MKVLPVLLAALLLTAGQALAIPSLLVNGVNGGVLLANTNQDLTSANMPLANNTLVRFTMIGEYYSGDALINTFGFYNIPTPYNLNPIFDQLGPNNVPQGAVLTRYMASNYGLFLFNDTDDDGLYEPAPNPAKDVILMSQRALTMPGGSAYQWFRAYDVSMYGVANYSFNGRLFSGRYDYLLFIDDDHVTNSNYDHDDMIVGMTVVPEPATLILIGLGLAGTALMRRRKM